MDNTDTFGQDSIDFLKVLKEDINDLQKQIVSTNLPEQLQEELMTRLKRIVRTSKFGNYSAEYEKISKYVSYVTNIPWSKFVEDNLDLDNARKILERNHYGIFPVKNRILEYLAVMNLNKRNKNVFMMRSPILCFVGLQGIGKTTMAQSIAEALGRPIIRVSLGAIGDVRTLRGESRINTDAEPGQIIKSLIRSKVMNPLILLDEIDKVSGEKGLLSDVMAALLEILDPAQNSSFVDHYIDYPIDLSRVMFIATANNLGTLSTALLDRLEIIRFVSYTDEEKKIIAQKYLLPKVLAFAGLKSGQVEFREEIWPIIIRPLGYDAGIRQLERNLTRLARRIAKMIIEEKGTKFVINSGNIKEFLPDDITVM